MKRAPRWLSRRALVLLHEESLATFGGARGLRDEGALESALARPLHLLTNRAGTTIAELAACYAFGLARNHPFVDGNKRAAFLAIGVFLALNGWRLAVPQTEAIRTMMALASGDLDEASLAAWIEAHLVPAPRTPPAR